MMPVVAGALLLSTGNADEPRKLGDTLQLMVDRSIIDTLDGGASLRLGVPSAREVVIASEEPWEGHAFFISSIHQHNGLYHMLYRGMNTGSGREAAEHVYLCLATSEDAVTWEKPAPGLVEFKGSKDNNIVAHENGRALTWCFTFYDPRPDTPENERVKAIDGAGEIRVERQDDAGQPLPGYSLADCDLLIGDRIAGMVGWRGRQSVARYIGKPIRLRFEMMDADPYGFRFPGAPGTN